MSTYTVYLTGYCLTLIDSHCYKLYVYIYYTLIMLIAIVSTGINVEPKFHLGIVRIIFL